MTMTTPEVGSDTSDLSEHKTSKAARRGSDDDFDPDEGRHQAMKRDSEILKKTLQGDDSTDSEAPPAQPRPQKRAVRRRPPPKAHAGGQAAHTGELATGTRARDLRAAAAEKRAVATECGPPPVTPRAVVGSEHLGNGCGAHAGHSARLPCGARRAK